MTVQQEQLGQLYQDYYPLLFAIAYRMLGSASDAEDIVQESYLRYAQAADKEIHSPKSYLTTIVTHLCLDKLKSAQQQREQYVGVWLPEPLLTTETDEPAWQAVEQHESVSVAFLLLLERLTPYERAVFLLREVFSYSYEEIAEIVGKNAVYCRQIFHQAKTHLNEQQRFPPPSKEAQQRLVERFIAASEHGDMQGLTSVLAQDVSWWGDGGGKVYGGKVYAVPHPLRGRERVQKFLQGILRKAPAWFPDLHFTATSINGAVGLLVWSGESLIGTIAFETTEEQILAMYQVLNPDKLAYIQQRLQPSQ